MASVSTDAGRVVGRVALLMRFPVKSTAGEELERVAVDARGLRHDREWAVYTADGGIGSGKTTRRFRAAPGLMRWRSAAPAGRPGPVLLQHPDGQSFDVEDPQASTALSQWFGRPLTLRREGDTPHHDDCPVHLVTTSALRQTSSLAGGAVDPRRLRANLVLQTDGEGFVEDAWGGAALAVGPEVVLRLGEAMPRCVMVDQPQAGVVAAPQILKPLGQAHEVLLGMKAEVLRPGGITLGDEARLLAHPSVVAASG